MHISFRLFMWQNVSDFLSFCKFQMLEYKNTFNLHSSVHMLFLMDPFLFLELLLVHLFVYCIIVLRQIYSFFFWGKKIVFCGKLYFFMIFQICILIWDGKQVIFYLYFYHLSYDWCISIMVTHE